MKTGLDRCKPPCGATTRRPLVVFRGDDTDFTWNNAIGFSLSLPDDEADGMMSSLAKVVFRFGGAEREFSSPFPSSREFTLSFTKEETAAFPLGRGFAEVRVYDSQGRTRTVDNGIPVVVTSDADFAYIASDDNFVTVSVDNAGAASRNELEALEKRVDNAEGEISSIKGNAVSQEAFDQAKEDLEKEIADRLTADAANIHAYSETHELLFPFHALSQSYIFSATENDFVSLELSPDADAVDYSKSYEFTAFLYAHKVPEGGRFYAYLYEYDDVVQPGATYCSYAPDGVEQDFGMFSFEGGPYVYEVRIRTAFIPLPGGDTRQCDAMVDIRKYRC